MPLPDDASLYVPYIVNLIPNGDTDKYVVVQKDGDDLIYVSPITWPTQVEAERHAHDLNWLREKAVAELPSTNLIIGIDIAAEGPDAVVVIERLLKDKQVVGWRLLNPAADEDNDAWNEARTAVQNAVEVLGQDELPEDDETLQDHLISRHNYTVEETERNDDTFDAMEWAEHHRTHLHGPGADWDHTHEWKAEEVDDDAPSDAPEGAHEDASS